MNKYQEFPNSGLEIPMPPIPTPKGVAKSITDVFDVRNPSHLQAYDELLKTGTWPKGFADGLFIPPGWNFIITQKLADAWVAHAMEAGGLKLKLHQAKVRLSSLNDHRVEVETAIAVMGEVEHTLLA